jgi:hypothetical protein
LAFREGGAVACAVGWPIAAKDLAEGGHCIPSESVSSMS